MNGQSAAEFLNNLEKGSETISKESRLGKYLSETPNLIIYPLFSSFGKFTHTCVYCIFTKHNFKPYIGSTKTFQVRMQKHRQNLTRCMHGHLQFHRSFKKYGKKDFYVFILQMCTSEELADLEYSFIQKFDAMNSGYNLTEDTSRNFEKYNGVPSPGRKKVCMYNKQGSFIREFPCVKDAAESVGSSTTNISAVCKKLWGKRTVKGFVFRYKEDTNCEDISPTTIQVGVELPTNLRKILLLNGKKVIDIDRQIVWPSYNQCAKDMGVNVSTISTAVKRDTWRGFRLRDYEDIVHA